MRHEYELRRCVSCGHTSAHGPAGPDLLKAVYSGHFHRSSQQFAAWPEKTSDDAMRRAAPAVHNAIVRARMLSKHRQGGRLLDVGAGCGFFVRATQDHFDAEGIEISESATAIARSIGARVHCADFMSDDTQLGEYDIVTLWDVLAGFADPAAALRRVAARLKPGGMLVLTVPDTASRTARLLGRFWPLLIPPINLNYFTQSSLRYFLESAGIHPVEMYHDKKRVALDFLAVKALRTLGLSQVTTLGIPSRFALEVDLGDILTVVALRTASVA